MKSRIWVFLLATLIVGTPAALQAQGNRGGNKGKGGFEDEATACFVLSGFSAGSQVFFGDGDEYCHAVDGQITTPTLFRYDPGKFNESGRTTSVDLRGSTGSDRCDSSDLACLGAWQVGVLQTQALYVPDGSGGFDYAGGIELDFPAMSQGQVAGVGVKFDFAVGPRPWDARRLGYGMAADPRMDCPVGSGAQPVEVECTCSDGLECRAWTLRASKACLSVTKNAEILLDTVDAGWELTLTAQGEACVP